MTTDRRPLGLPAFSEPATDTVNAPTGSGDERRPPAVPIEQGADFRQPPSEEVPAPRAVRNPLAVGGMTFSDPGGQI
ncbi:hypothetical protein P3T36_004082 [Kitasatospora sp. MAP12-15]|uniref:hypothetical protein n=1 Tax=unclassified Kitasatospora TaxID=2633591 RepID=UPI002474BC38|nr:hypothetical protein [Kitasatospora sp. MAP12-44]MDH6115163.1 hypothetical protein [Kitasatospora sp. MAP12-44]